MKLLIIDDIIIPKDRNKSKLLEWFVDGMKNVKSNDKIAFKTMSKSGTTLSELLKPIKESE